jgi:hypothetical protein
VGVGRETYRRPGRTVLVVGDVSRNVGRGAIEHNGAGSGRETLVGAVVGSACRTQ